MSTDDADLLCPICGKPCTLEDGPECYLDDYMPTKIIVCPEHGEVSPPSTA